MTIRIRSQKDFGIGLLYGGLGVVGLTLALGYPFGTPARMGAGFFPTIISSLLIVFAAVTIVRSLVADGAEIGEINWKGLFLITLSVCAFGLLLERIGLPLSIAASGLVAALASDRFAVDWKALLGLAAFAALCVAVFVEGLGLPMPTVGSALSGLGF
jgi:hypothetical protein